MSFPTGDGEIDRFLDDSDLELSEDDPKPIERPCANCGTPYNLSIALAAEIPPGSTFDICPGCMKQLKAEGRELRNSDKPVTD